jgi:hypothetical protein
MKKLLVLLVGGLLLASTAFGQTANGTAVQLPQGWVMDVTWSVPLLSIVQSNTPATKLDLHTNAGIGGGLTFYRGTLTVATNDIGFSINAPLFILTPRLGTEKDIDLIIGGDTGWIGNRLRVGVGYDFGTLAYPRSRWIGLLSIGVK